MVLELGGGGAWPGSQAGCILDWDGYQMWSGLLSSLSLCLSQPIYNYFQIREEKLAINKSIKRDI